MSTDREYLAEGTQSFFEDNDEQIPPNGIHNFVNTRAELFSYDRQLYDFITEIFPCKNKLLIRCDAIKGKTGRSLQAIFCQDYTEALLNAKYSNTKSTLGKQTHSSDQYQVKVQYCTSYPTLVFKSFCN